MSGSLGTGGIDSGIPLQAGRGVQQPNAMQTIGQFANIQNALNQNKLFPGQMTLQQQAIQSGQSDVTNKINSAAYRAAAPLLTGGPITHENLTSTLASIEKNLGLPTHQIINDVLATAPSGDGPEFDAKVRSLIASRSQVSPESAVGMVTNRTGPAIDVGPSIQPTTVAPPGAPNAGQIAPAGGSFGKGIGPQFVGTGAGTVPTNNGAPVGNPITNKLSPAQLSTPTQIGVDKNGAPVMGTLEQFLGKASGSPLGTGRPIPPALRGPNAPAPGVVTGLGPAETQQLATQGQASAHAFQDISDQGVQARGQNAILGNMLADTASFTTGPTSLNINKATLMRYAPAIAETFGIKPEAVAANESFDKLANQIAGAQGERSDARLSVAQGANPNSHLSQAGADLMLRQLQGNADYLQTRAQLAAQYPNQTDRAGFEAHVGSTLDPRAFQYERMTPTQRKMYAASLSDADRKIVQTSYNLLKTKNILGAQNAAQ